MHRVIITGPARSDIEADYDWWAQNRSVEQANHWYRGVYAAIESLRSNPERCSFASEKDLLAQGVRQLLFGVGRRATHRIVVAFEGNTVVVLRVRHTSRDALSIDELR
jgi:plasmid stabilization system protein ParE